METLLRVLHLEDEKLDAELVQNELMKEWKNLEFRTVSNKKAFAAALNEFEADVILSDHSLPSFNSIDAFEMVKEAKLTTPFILITGTVSEEFAVTMMKAGVTDYLLKDRIERLNSSIVAALAKRKVDEERELLWNKLLEQEALLKDAEKLAQLGSWRLDLSEGKMQWSDQCFSILGYAPQSVAPGYDLLLKHVEADDVEALKKAIKEALDKFSLSASEFRVKTIDGIKKWLYAEMAVERSANGEPTILRGFYQDISARKNSEAEILALNDSLEQKVKERTAALAQINADLESFSFSVSHDLRSPLQVINGYASILSMKYAADLNEDARQLLQGIKSYTKHMSLIIESMLNLSRLGRESVKKEMVDMNALVHAIVEELRFINTGKFDIDIQIMANALCDKELVKRVWANLISNAIKYSSTSAAPLIKIKATQEPDGITYSISDNGVGFDMKDADKLFNVFQRLNSSEGFEGTGVGLATVARIINMHDGKIWADSSPGKGATFLFSLPHT